MMGLMASEWEQMSKLEVTERILMVLLTLVYVYCVIDMPAEDSRDEGEYY